MANWIVLIVLSLVYVALLAFCFAEYFRRGNTDSKAVYLPKFMFWLGIAAGIIFLAFAWIAARQDGSIGLTVCFGLLALLGMSLLLGWKNCFISYDQSGLVRSNLLGIKRSFTYDQVTGLCINKLNPMESTVYVSGRKISFNMLSSNSAEFMHMLNAGYKRTHGNMSIPKLSGLKKEKGGFSAHVHNPGEYLAIFIMMLLFIVGLGAWITVDTLKPIDEDDGESFVLSFSSYAIEDGDIDLFTPQMSEAFVIFDYEEYLRRADELLKKCDSETSFSVCAERIEPDDSEAYYEVYALSSGEEIYRTFEDSNAYNREFLPIAIGIFGVLLLVVLAFSAFIYMVGSNPRKFPKWVVYACFKKGAIDF